MLTNKSLDNGSASPNKLFSGKSIKVSNDGGNGVDKLVIVTSGGGSTAYSQVTGGTKDGLLFFYDTNDKKLQVVDVHWGATTGNNKLNGEFTISIKTIAVFTNAPTGTFTSADIHVF